MVHESSCPWVEKSGSVQSRSFLTTERVFLRNFSPLFALTVNRRSCNFKYADIEFYIYIYLPNVQFQSNLVYRREFLLRALIIDSTLRISNDIH